MHVMRAGYGVRVSSWDRVRVPNGLATVHLVYPPLGPGGWGSSQNRHLRPPAPCRALDAASDDSRKGRAKVCASYETIECGLSDNRFRPRGAGSSGRCDLFESSQGGGGVRWHGVRSGGARVGPSAPLMAIPINLPARDPSTAPARPYAKADPPMAPSTDHLLLPCGYCGATRESETPLDLGGRIEESAHSREDLWVRDTTGMVMGNCYAPTLDPDVGAVQRHIRGCSRLQSWGHSLTQMAMWRSQRLAKTLVGLPQTGHSIGPVCGRSTTVPDDRQRCALSLEPCAHPHTP
jgi:hypothetical protein